MGFEVLDIGPFPETRCKISTGTITDVMAIKNLLNEAAYTIVDARYIIDRAQVASAVATACVAQREGRLLTRSLATEILYRISGSTNVSESLKQFGMGPKTTSVVIIETSSNDLTEWEKSKAFESDKDVTFRHDSGLIREAYKVPADFPDVDILKYVVNVISTKNI